MTSSIMHKVFALLLGILTTQVFAVSNGMVDTFENGSTDGWASGIPNPNPPVNIADGGPSGTGDGYLQITSSGTGGPGGRLVAFSGPQWAGDYIDAGVTAIGMHVNNLGATDLDLRLAFESASGNALSISAIQIAAGSGWTQVLFPVVPSALDGPVGVLSSVTQFRLYHNPDAVFRGTPIVAQLGVDNVTAVPEPETWVMLLAGLATVAAGTHSRRRQSR